jgi:hypothetical protein
MHYLDQKTAHTSAQHYRDLDGNMRNFTVVDHDPKTKISVPSNEGVDLKKALEDYREETIQKILAAPAVYCPMIFADYTIRGEQAGGQIIWNEPMLRNQGVPLNQLTDIYTLLSNTLDSRPKTSF